MKYKPLPKTILNLLVAPLSDRAVTAGDTPGHIFHGNQHIKVDSADNAPKIDKLMSDLGKSGFPVPIAPGKTVDEVLQSLRGGQPKFGYSPEKGETVIHEGRMVDAKPVGTRDLGWGQHDVYAPTLIQETMDKNYFPVRTPVEPKYLYRDVTDADWARIQKDGVVTTDARGTIEDPSAHFANASFEPGTSYLPWKGSSYDTGSGAGHILRIDYHASDGWFVDPVDSYARTSEPIPLSHVSMVSPPIIGDASTIRSLAAAGNVKAAVLSLELALDPL